MIINYNYNKYVEMYRFIFGCFLSCPCSLSLFFVSLSDLLIFSMSLNWIGVCLLWFLVQFVANAVLQGFICACQHCCHFPACPHNHPASCSIQHSVGVCSSGLFDVCHVGSRVPLSDLVSGNYVCIYIQCRR